MSDHTQLHLARSALLTIDVQNDFTLAGAPGEVPGTHAVVPALRRVVAGFRAAGRPIIHAVRLYRRDGSNVDLPRRKTIEEGTAMVAPGTVGAQLVQGLAPDGEVALDADLLLAQRFQALGSHEWVMYKPRWGAFFATPLQAHLQDLGVDTLVVGGCNFPNCPRTTVYEASERDYRIALITDATSGLYDRARTELENIGVHLLDANSCINRLEHSITVTSSHPDQDTPPA